MAGGRADGMFGDGQCAGKREQQADHDISACVVGTGRTRRGGLPGPVRWLVRPVDAVNWAIARLSGHDVRFCRDERDMADRR
jgi:hypothetical protein